MMPEVRSKYDLRCFCSSEPLVAKWGRDRSGSPFIHVKVYKQKRLYSEIVVTEGNEVRIRCRNCLRWHRIRVRREVEFSQDTLPSFIPTSRSA